MPVKIDVNARNDLLGAAAALHAVAFAVPWLLEMNVALQILLSLLVLAAARRLRRDSVNGRRLCGLELGPGKAMKADIGGVLHVVRGVQVIFLSCYCLACELRCANGDRFTVRVLARGVDDGSQYRALCRYLRAGCAW